jgi:hypothetical protein
VRARRFFVVDVMSGWRRRPRRVEVDDERYEVVATRGSTAAGYVGARAELARPATQIVDLAPTEPRLGCGDQLVPASEVERAEAEIKELRGQRDHAEEKMRYWHGRYDEEVGGGPANQARFEVERQLSEALLGVERLREALQKYGEHKPTCNATTAGDRAYTGRHPTPCTCGFREVARPDEPRSPSF